MASLFLAIPDFKTKVQADTDFVGVKPEGTLLPLQSFEFSVFRPASMKIGATAVKGTPHLTFTPVKMVRYQDEASEQLLSYLLMPGSKGLDCCFYKCRLLTMPTGGKAICPFLNVDIFNCRIRHLTYDLEGDTLLETYHLAYARMSMWGANYDDMNEGVPKSIQKTWAYNLATGVAQARRKSK